MEQQDKSSHESGLDVSAHGCALPLTQLDTSVTGSNLQRASLGGSELISFVVDVNAPLTAPEVINPRVLAKVRPNQPFFLTTSYPNACTRTLLYFAM